VGPFEALCRVCFYVSRDVYWYANGHCLLPSGIEYLERAGSSVGCSVRQRGKVIGVVGYLGRILVCICCRSLFGG